MPIPRNADHAPPVIRVAPLGSLHPLKIDAGEQPAHQTFPCLRRIHLAVEKRASQLQLLRSWLAAEGLSPGKVGPCFDIRIRRVAQQLLVASLA